jgi:hypothetical protein
LKNYKNFWERGREERKRWEVVRDTTFKEGGINGFFFPPVLKVPRQCPLALPVEVYFTGGEASGSE